MMQTPSPSWYGVRSMRTLALVSLALLPAGCGLVSGLVQPLVETSVGKWFQLGPVRRDLQELTTMTRDLCFRQGYEIPDFDADRGYLITDWRVQLSAHFREGNRTRIEVHFHPNADGSTVIRIRSYREINENSSLPMSADQAEWVGASIDAKQSEYMDEPSIRLQQMLKLKLFGLQRD